MNLTCPKSRLAPALALAARVVERRNTIPILSNLRLTATVGPDGTGGLEIFATDLDRGITIDCPAEVTQAGATTAPAHLLAEMLRKMPDGDVTLAASEADSQMRVSAGRSRFALPTLPEADMPEMADFAPAARFRLSGPELGGLLAPTAMAISTEETRYYLNGIHLHVDRQAADSLRGPVDDLVAVATDGHRLSLARRPMPAGAAKMPRVIVPTKTVAEWQRLAKAAEAPIEITVSDAKIALATRAEGLGVRLVSKLIDGTFPDYARVIPNAPPARAEVDRALLAAVVDRVATVSAGKGSRAVRFDWSADGLRLSVTDVDRGTAEETIDLLDWDGEPLTIGFNASYVAQALDAIVTPRVAVRLSDAGSPTLLEPVAPATDAPGQLIVLMPMRV